MQGTINKGHNHSITISLNMLIRNIYKKAKPQRLSQEAQPPDHRGEPNQRVPLLTPELTSYSLKDYEF
jgi:hypothetical protein